MNKTRKEQIEEHAQWMADHYPGERKESIITGAMWADANPNNSALATARQIIFDFMLENDTDENIRRRGDLFLRNCIPVQNPAGLPQEGEKK